MKKMALSPVHLSEVHVSAQVSSFLRHRAWRQIRFQRTVVPGIFSTHEPGIPDMQFIRYLDCAIPGAAFVLWIEFKAAGVRARCRCATKAPRQRCTACDQARWKRDEIARGALVWTVDSLESFAEDYERTFGFLHHGPVSIGQSFLPGVS